MFKRKRKYRPGHFFSQKPATEEKSHRYEFIKVIASDQPIENHHINSYVRTPERGKGLKVR